MNFLRLRRRCRPPGADCPHGFVGHHCTSKTGRTGNRNHGIQLRTHDPQKSHQHPAGPAFRRRRGSVSGQPSLQPRISPRPPHPIRNTTRDARVTDDHEAATEIAEHRRRHLASVGTRACSLRLCAPSAPALQPAWPATARRYGKGAQTATSTLPALAIPASRLFSNSLLAARLPCIFQLPTTSFDRIRVVRTKPPNYSGYGRIRSMNRGIARGALCCRDGTLRRRRCLCHLCHTGIVTTFNHYAQKRFGPRRSQQDAPCPSSEISAAFAAATISAQSCQRNPLATPTLTSF